MTKLKALLIGASALVLISYPGSFAIAQSALSIGDNDSVLIDGTSFKVLPGKAKGDASTLIRTMGAQPLGPDAVIFRSGDKLYIADAGPLEGVRLGGSRNDYGGSRNDYGGSRNDYGSSRNDYASERSNGERVVIDDPDYAQYRLRKMFVDHWTGPRGETYLGVQDQFLRQSNGE
jgi:hypothetical protein